MIPFCFIIVKSYVYIGSHINNIPLFSDSEFYIFSLIQLLLVSCANTSVYAILNILVHNKSYYAFNVEPVNVQYFQML